MRDRREMKKRAKQVVRAHYGIFLVVCLIAAYIGSEFGSSLDFVKQTDPDVLIEAKESGEVLSTGMTTGVYEITSADAIIHAVTGDIERGKEISEKITEHEVSRAKSGGKHRIFGKSRGVFAGISNGMKSGSIIVFIISAARNIGMSQNIVLGLYIVIAVLFAAGIWFFLTNMYRAVTRRIFLEARIYEKVPFKRMFMFIRVKRWFKVSVTMFMKSLFQFLWSLTIVGGIIKRYSYYLVPYIVAENPDIHWRDAITLSRKMMDGHKWECFVYRVTFIGWDILGIITLGISDLFFANQYRTATFAEYYTDLRQLAKENEIENHHLMNDQYLFEKADTNTLDEHYYEVLLLQKEPEVKIPLTGFRGFLADVFGITIFNREDEKQFEESEIRMAKLDSMKSIMEGREYPARLFSIPENQKNKKLEYIRYLRHYSIPSLILLFFIFSFVGWMWEVGLHLIIDGAFVNRGVLHGPWLPIYGVGGVMILTILNKFRKNPTAEFFASIILCGCVEYIGAYYLETIHNGQKWWDYSGYFLNLHGRICAEGLLIFGIGGMAIVYFLAPVLDNYLRKIKYQYAIPLCMILLLTFSGDQIYSMKHPNAGKGITDYESVQMEHGGWDD